MALLENPHAFEPPCGRVARGRRVVIGHGDVDLVPKQHANHSVGLVVAVKTVDRFHEGVPAKKTP